jgi:hypothetical protein
MASLDTRHSNMHPLVARVRNQGFLHHSRNRLVGFTHQVRRRDVHPAGGRRGRVQRRAGEELQVRGPRGLQGGREVAVEDAWVCDAEEVVALGGKAR